MIINLICSITEANYLNKKMKKWNSLFEIKSFFGSMYYLTSLSYYKLTSGKLFRKS